MFVGMSSDETGMMNDNLVTWEVKSSSKRELVLSMSFKRIINVSQGEERDEVFVVLFEGLNEFAS